MRKTFELLLVAVMSLAFFSCKDDDGADDYINLSTSVLRFEGESGQQTLLLKSSVTFDQLYADCNAEWVTLEEKAEQGALVVKVTANPGSTVRSAILTLKAGNYICEVDVLQEKQPLALELTAENGKCWDTNTQLAFGIRTAQAWTATTSGNWFKLAKTSGEGPYCMTVIFDRNTTEAERTGEVTVKVENGAMRTFTFTQSEALPEGRMEDSLALVALYKHFNGAENWAVGYKWDLDEPMDNWTGVRLENDRVFGLSLSVEKPCTGTEFPKEFRNLSALEEFSLARNTYSGELPYELARASRLGMLVLDESYTTGVLPAWMGNFGQLIEFRTSYSKLGGELPWELQACPLHLMRLNYCSFSGELPAGWTLPDVHTLQLVANQLTGPIPESFGHLGENGSGLNEVNFMDNPGLIGDIPVNLCKRAGVALKITRTSLNDCNF